MTYPGESGNAVRNAPTPHLDLIASQSPGCRLSASGLDVGLPEGQMGNSEVGHTNIGAGRVVFQDFPRISRDIETLSLIHILITLILSDTLAPPNTATKGRLGSSSALPMISSSF